MATNYPRNDSSWLFNIAMENGLFIDGLPIENGWIFHGHGNDSWWKFAWVLTKNGIWCFEKTHPPSYGGYVPQKSASVLNVFGDPECHSELIS